MSKDKTEMVPLARAQSLYNPQRDKYHSPTTMHSPPLILHTPDANRRPRVDHNISVLEESPRSKRENVDRINDSIGGDKTDSRGRKPNNRRKNNTTKERDNTDNNNHVIRNKKRLNIQINYRNSKHKSPAPIDDARKPSKLQNNSTTTQTQRHSGTMSIGMLDSDPNSDFEDEARKRKELNIKSRELLVYFAQLARSKNTNETIDIRKIDTLLTCGADINHTDKYGQTVVHEIARNWHIDIAKYFIKKGVAIDKGDKYGRTALHLSSSIGYTEMIEFLIQNKARIHACTKDEKQTPIHYAAKNNSVSALKVLIRLGASVNDRDYRLRTPLFLAVENGRVEAALYLLKTKTPAAVYNDEGVSCLSLMVQRMPDVALVALKLFYIEDHSHRKRYCYLNYLENKLTSEEERQISWKYLTKYERQKQKREMSLVAMVSKKGIKKGDLVKSVLETIVDYNEVSLVNHPVIRLLIQKKWMWCGRRAALFGVFINIFYALLWSAIGIATPITGHDIYRPFSQWWYVIVLEVLGVGMTIYFMANHIMEAQITKRRNKAYRTWFIAQVERDLKFCHPRWPEERRHIDETVDTANWEKRSKLSGWNFFDWFVYLLILIVMATRLLNLILDEPKLKKYHIRIFSFSLIFVWLRVLRRLRPFPSFGPFIIMLGYVVIDTLKFLVLFLGLFIPYCVAFWMIFGGPRKSNETTNSYLENINDLVYTVFQITVIGDYEWTQFVTVDKTMAQILTGTYMVIVSVICVCLYIALLANTFSRVYPQAKANALLIQASKILLIERTISKGRKLSMRAYIHENCAPLVEATKPESITIATNNTTLSVNDFNLWKHRYESETDEFKFSVKELHTKQDQLLNHFKLILQNMDDEEDLVEEI